MIREGSWSLRSKSDPRWNTDGRGMVSGMGPSTGAQEAVRRLTAELGEPPSDLTYSWMKD